jgi:3-phosphoshikimate 1-carboxyvinyltransferase
MGINAAPVNGNGCPPVEIKGCPRPLGGEIKIDCSVSSQFLTALLLIAPYTENGLTIHVTKGPVSKPYIDMTLHIMEKSGITCQRKDYMKFHIPGSQIYSKGRHKVETDASNAGYFWAAAAVTQGRVLVKGIDYNSCQGDLGLIKCLEKMGCVSRQKQDGIEVTGRPLSAIDADMVICRTWFPPFSAGLRLRLWRH